MKSKSAVLVVVALFVVCSAGLMVGQSSSSTPASARVTYVASATDTTPDGSPEAWIATAAVAPEVARVREAVDKFAVNFESRDVDRLKNESWPSMTPKAYSQLKNTFATLSQITLQEDCVGSPVIVIDSADWACSEKFGYQVNGEQRPTQTHALQFHLKKVEGKWYVEGRTVAGK